MCPASGLAPRAVTPLGTRSLGSPREARPSSSRGDHADVVEGGPVLQARPAWATSPRKCQATAWLNLLQTDFVFLPTQGEQD